MALTPRKFGVSCAALLALLRVAGAPSASARGAPFDYGRQVGVAVDGPAGACLEIPSDSLHPGGKVTLVWPLAPQRFAEAQIVRRSPGGCGVKDASGSAAPQYEIRLTEPEPEGSGPAIAVYGVAGRFELHGGRVFAQLDSSGPPATFRACTSAEGVHLTVWSGRPLSGKRLWHRYYYLGYDVEPDCTPADYGP